MSDYPGGGGASQRNGALLVAGVFVLLTAVLTLPLSLEPATRAMALSADTRLFLWTLSWDVHALLHQPLRLFDANIFHPEPRTLAYSEHVVGSAIVGAPFLIASGNPVLALNAVILLSCVLSGAGTFFLARELGISRAGAFAAGVIFAFAPPRFTRLAQLHLATVQWIPFCLAFVHRYLRGYHRRDLIAAIFFFTLQSITSGHGGLFLLLALLALGLYLMARRSLPPLRTLARDVGIVGVLLLALNLPFALPYFRVQRELGLRRTIGAVYDWVPNAASFLASPSYVDQAVVSLVPPAARAVADAKAYMFPGWLTLLLLAALLLSRRQAGEGAPRRPAGDLGFYAVLAGLALWASLGPPFGLYALLYHALPGFDLIRVPSRLAILTELALAVLAGAGASRLVDRLRPPLRGWAGGALVLLLAAEFATPLNAPVYPIETGEVDRWLAAQAKPFVAAELPVAPPTDAVASARLQSHYMLHSMLHWQPIVNGYSGFVPPRHEMLFDQLTRFPDEGSVRALETLGVNYVVLHRADFGEERYAKAVADAQALFPTRLIVAHDAADGRVYSVRFAKPKGQR
ncbi:MAG TPA: hypothetical protein VII62_15450 [Vicinamibacteria bacterium]